MTREISRHEQNEGLLPPERSMDRVPVSMWLSRYRDSRQADTRDLPLGGTACWCGRPAYHDWEGKADGEVHPR
jgi:hypothetical protein